MEAVAEGGPDGAWAVILVRRVSGRPGAEGAPLEGCGREMGICWRVVVLVVEEGWFEGGAMRRDCFGLLVLFWFYMIEGDDGGVAVMW